MKHLLLLIASHFLFILNAFTQHWLPLDTTLRTNGYGYKLFNDITTDKLYLFGSFNNVGAAGTHNIVAYDGTTWDILEGGAIGTNVQSVVRFGNDIIAGGSFCGMGTHFCSDSDAVIAQNIAAWDGQQWQALGSGIHGVVNCLMVDGNNLYVGGLFDSAGSVPANGLARWDGQQWYSMNIPDYSNGVWIKAIAIYKNEFYAAGNINSQDVSGIGEIIRYNGQVWSDVGGGMQTSGEIQDIAIYKNELYVSGNFSLGLSPNTPGNYIARWDGEQWKPVGSGVFGLDNTIFSNAQIWDLYVFHDRLYASGVFQYTSDISAPYIASWDGNRWCSMYTNFFYGLNRPDFLGDWHDTLLTTGIFKFPNFPDGQGNNTRLEVVARYAGGDEACGQVYTTVINEYTKNSKAFSVYPNPTENVLHIESNTNIQASDVIIYNAMGKEVMKIKYTSNLDVSSLHSGVYILQIQNSKTLIGICKFIKH